MSYQNNVELLGQINVIYLFSTQVRSWKKIQGNSLYLSLSIFSHQNLQWKSQLNRILKPNMLVILVVKHHFVLRLQGIQIHMNAHHTHLSPKPQRGRNLHRKKTMTSVCQLEFPCKLLPIRKIQNTDFLMFNVNSLVCRPSIYCRLCKYKF